jgi:excisionase family DNA binding protein
LFVNEKLYTIEPRFSKYMSEETKLLSVAEAAAKLGITRGRVNQFISEERLSAQKVGRAYVIKEEDLNLIEKRQNGRPSKTKEDETLKSNPASGLEREN